MKYPVRNKELSWLSFNERLLQEADRQDVPLLERLRFLGIYSNNLDEFFRVRVAILRRLAMVNRLTLEDGNNPAEILQEIEAKVKEMGNRFSAVYKRVFQELESEGIYIINENKLDEKQKIFVHHYFHETIRPRIIPLLLHKKTPLRNLEDDAFYLGIKIRGETGEKNKYGLIEVPTDTLDRFIHLPSTRGEHHIMMLEDAIRVHLGDIFYMSVYQKIAAYSFKLTRDAELDINDDVDISYLQAVEASLDKRKVARPVRLVHDAKMPADLLNMLEKVLGFSKKDTIIAGGRYQNSKDFMKFPTLGKKHLLYPPLPSVPHKDLKSHESILSALKTKDVLLHFPYHSFNHVIDLLREAAIDPHVKEIKITIYRVARQSNVMNALINAARNGKKVTVLLELRARFDEKSNIIWSEQLREEGITVIHGVAGIKVHCKLILITRKNGKVLEYYACIGTGNFNEETTPVFSDHLLCTSNREITREVASVFDFFNRNYKIKRYRHLLVSPNYIRNRLGRMINQEIRHAKEGKPAYLYIKVNNIGDGRLIRKLYQARECGVDVRLNVRGMFSVYPTYDQVENSIPSIGLIDRYLEHSRIFIFCNGGKEVIYISSADLMTRNMDRRVEVATPVYDKQLHKEIRTMWDYQWQDTLAARILDNQLTNPLRTLKKGAPFRSQVEFYKYIKKSHHPKL